MKPCIKRRFILPATLLAGFLLAAKPAAEATDRPNVVLIMVDDMGWSDLGCYGGEIETPNIDRLAAGGLRFRQFYNTAKCGPTRASLLTGLNWQTAGRNIASGRLTLAQAMRLAGYATFAVGKWHLGGNPVDRGFDRYFGHLSGATNFFKGNKSFRLDDQPFDVPDQGFYTTDAFTDYAIQFLEESRRSAPDKPFFLYLAYNAPHAPLQAWEEDIAKYRGRYDIGWDRVRAGRYARQKKMGLIEEQWGLSPRPDAIPAWESLTEREQAFEAERMAVYAAMIDRVDQNVGRLMRKLSAWGVQRNTLVMFPSDNGASPFDRSRRGRIGRPDSRWNYGIAWANACNTPFRLYKRNQHNGGVATPFIAHWPAVIDNGGAMTDQPGHLVDIMATMMDAAGWSYPDRLNGRDLPPLVGRSLLPIFAGKQPEPRGPIHFQFLNHRALIDAGGRWKLVSAYGGPWELYDLRADRTELHDLSNVHTDRRDALAARWNAWWNDLENKEPTGPNGGPPGYRGLGEPRSAAANPKKK